MVIKSGDRLFTGAIVSPQFAATYNAATAKIESFIALGRNAPENLLNGRHNMFQAFAHNPSKESPRDTYR